MNTKLFTTHGYTEHDRGYSGMFSWFRTNKDWRFWHVVGFGDFTRDGRAITDDFGNLVGVK